jgi:hypothetical protein
LGRWQKILHHREETEDLTSMKDKRELNQPQSSMNEKRTIVGYAGILFVTAWAGCASYDAANQESMLVASGFRERVPETARQRELYAAAPAYQVQRVSANGKVFYAYKDESKGVAYVGGETEYQRYQQMAVEQRIATSYYRAAEMNRDAAMGWYGAYGPYVFARPVRTFR